MATPTPNQAHVIELVTTLIALAKSAKALKSTIDQTLSFNSAQSIDWANYATKFATLLDADGSGNIAGMKVTPAMVSNLIGSLAAYQGAFWTTNGGNIELMATPTV